MSLLPACSGCGWPDVRPIRRGCQIPSANPFATASNDHGAAPARQCRFERAGAAQRQLCRRRASEPGRRIRLAAARAGDDRRDRQGRRPTQPIGGFGNGWRAAGGSPIVVADGENLDDDFPPLRRAAVGLAAGQWLHPASQVHGGVRLIVPVYDALSEIGLSRGARKLRRRRRRPPSDEGRRTKGQDKTATTKRRTIRPRIDAKTNLPRPKEKGKDKPRKTSRATTSRRARKVFARRSQSRRGRRQADAAVKAAKPREVAKADIAPRPRAPAKKKARLRSAADRQRPCRGAGAAARADRRPGRRGRRLAGIPLAGARPHHPGLQGRRQ